MAAETGLAFVILFTERGISNRWEAVADQYTDHKRERKWLCLCIGGLCIDELASAA